MQYLLSKLVHNLRLKASELYIPWIEVYSCLRGRSHDCEHLHQGHLTDRRKSYQSDSSIWRDRWVVEESQRRGHTTRFLYIKSRSSSTRLASRFQELCSILGKLCFEQSQMILCSLEPTCDQFSERSQLSHFVFLSYNGCSGWSMLSIYLSLLRAISSDKVISEPATSIRISRTLDGFDL